MNEIDNERITVDADEYARNIRAALAEGHEAGRLAAIRAEVERAMPGMAAHASRLLRDGLVDLQEARREKPGGYRFLLIQDAEGKIATAWLFAAEVADCRRWLEATR